MGMELTKYIVKSIFRRRKEIFKVCLATVIAMFFVSGMLATQESLYRWQMAKNKSVFGDWFVMTGDDKREAFDNHPYFGEPQSAFVSVYLYDEDMKTKLDYFIGSMSQEFIDLGNITLAQGHWPETTLEVAMDYNTLLSMGFPLEVGQEIELRYYEYNANHIKTCARTEKYILSGIINDYTNTWRAGAFLPSIVVTQEKARQMNPNGFTFLIYPLATYVKTENYHAIYDDIKKTIRSAVYNENVYDFTPWGSQAVYNYLYVLIILIGVVAIAYQMNIYYRYRNSQLEMLRKIGASKGQIRGIKLLEKLLIVGISGIAGAVLGIVAVRAVCSIIEKNLSVDFFYLGSDVYIRTGISIIIAYALATLLQLLISISPKLKDNKNYNFKTQISTKNVRKTIGSRLRKSNGKALNIGVRAFCLVMSVVIIVCSVIIVQSYVEYVDNSNEPDIIGFESGEQSKVTMPLYMKDHDFLFMSNPRIDEMIDDFITEHTKDDFKQFNYKLIETYNIISQPDRLQQILLNQAAPVPAITQYFLMLPFCYYSQAYKMPDTYIYSGIKDNLKNSLEKIAGIEEYALSSFETSRRFSWDNMDYNKLDLKDMCGSYEGVFYKDNYYYATDYIESSKEIYERLSQYVDENYIDYDAFAKGEQVIVILKNKPDGSLDTTIKPGSHIYYSYLDTPILRLTEYPDVDRFISVFNNNLNKSRKELFNSLCKKYGVKELSVLGSYISEISQAFSEENAKKIVDVYSDKNYEYLFGSVDNPVVAGVVKYSDELQKEFADICVDYGYYTVIASTALAEKLIEKQNAFIKDYYGEYLEDGALFSYEPNQIAVKYDLSSAYSSTHNLVKQTFKSLNMKYISNYEKKTEYRSRCLNAIMQYGITIIAAMAVNICIILILLKNRLDKKKDRMKLLSQLGMTKKELFLLNMKEVLREEVWCVFTMPITAIISAIMIKKYVKTLNN